MTNEERDIINQFIARVGGAPAGGQGSQWGGSVPATQPALPPVDPEADALIRQSFQRYPEAPYRITQLAFVQEHALIEAQNRIKRLEWELQQAQQAAQQASSQQQQPASGGGFFSGLFGGGKQQNAPQPGPGPAWTQGNQGGGPGPAWNQGAAAPPPYQQAPPPPQYPPNYQPGIFQRQGSGFLGSALTTAAGVAGGVVAADALMGLFHHGGGGFGGGYPAGYPVGGPAVESPWAAPAGGGLPQQDYVDQGSWDNSAAAPASNQDYVDNGSWDQSSGSSGNDASWDSSSNDGGSWDNSGSGDGGSWDSGGGGSDSLC